MAQEGYPKGWTKLTDALKEHANKRCQLCDDPPPSGQPHTLQTHHLDHNRNNCEPSNLIPLCQRCHERLQKIKITMPKAALLDELSKARQNINYQPRIF